MAIVDKEIADRIVAGMYAEDNAVKIVRYKDALNGADAYGVIFEGQDLDRYSVSPFILNPQTYWTREGGLA